MKSPVSRASRRAWEAIQYFSWPGAQCNSCCPCGCHIRKRHNHFRLEVLNGVLGLIFVFTLGESWQAHHVLFPLAAAANSSCSKSLVVHHLGEKTCSRLFSKGLWMVTQLLAFGLDERLISSRTRSLIQASSTSFITETYKREKTDLQAMLVLYETCVSGVVSPRFIMPLTMETRR